VLFLFFREEDDDDEEVEVLLLEDAPNFDFRDDLLLGECLLFDVGVPP
jgi:hypothetical protein